ncbi:MAG: cytochrome c [Magnetococcales bacterium]|nr:cytochrome c [Magnetococcales bacterium]
MSRFTQNSSRNLFYGGSLFFFFVLIGLTFDTMGGLSKRDHRENITPQVAHGKRIWEANNCVGCHTIMGEGAYFAPELGNVYARRGPDFIKGWIQSQPTGVKGRRQMPQFHLTEEELDAIVAFLKWTGEINNAKWPPNVEG